jgi:hypothetical protein
MNNPNKILPEKYVWHVSSRENDLSIGADGVLAVNDGYVYANNQSHQLLDMWPIPIDKWDFKENYELELRRYTWWRIDTEISGFEWEIDPIMIQDQGIYTSLPMTCYIRTKASIDPKYLTPFHWSGDKTNDLNVHVEDGAISVSSPSNGLDLKIDQILLDWMRARGQINLTR